MPTSIITTEDLQKFRMDLLADIERLLEEKTQLTKPKNWLRSTEVMDHMKISHATLQNLRNNQTIPSYKVEGLIYYDREEIDAIIGKHKLSPVN
ncbi:MULTISPECIES: helix-turn-helix domain-containing protein [unclassified Croceitalea]|uniref:helix-turn-helix domain-containing protein n=1 Tax=unclassified Croceitalea TaxID=2632280 RepID=UPI0030D8BC10